MKTKTSIYLMRNNDRIDFVETNISMKINGIKLKSEKLGDMDYTRIYQLGEFCKPPYSIVYYLPDISLSCVVNFNDWNFNTQFTDNFKIMGLAWLLDPSVALRTVKILSDAFIDLTFIAINPPIKPTEHITTGMLKESPPPIYQCRSVMKPYLQKE